jgi:hypothetical protein
LIASGTVATETTSCGLAAHRQGDARWIKNQGRSFFGYENHVNTDAKHKLIRY